MATEIRQAEERLREAMLKNDVSTLSALLHDDLVFTGPDGAVVGKEDDLKAHQEKRLRLDDLKLEDLQIREDGPVDATSIVNAKLTGTYDGEKCDGEYRYTRKWRKTDAGWQIIAGQIVPKAKA